MLICLSFNLVAPFADLKVLLTVVFVRAAIAFAHLMVLLGPVQTWQRNPEQRELLLEADRCIEQLPRRFTIAYVLGWTLAMGVALLLGHLGWPRPLPLGNVELLVGGLRVLAMVVGIPVLLGPLLEHMLLHVQRDIGLARRAHGLGHAPPTETIGRSLLVFTVGLVAAVIVGLSSAVVQQHAEGRRDAAVAEQRGRANMAALLLADGHDVLEPGLSVLDEPELPEPLLWVRDDHPERSVLTTVDRRSELALAAVLLDDGRWLVAEAPVEQELDFVIVMLLLFVPIGLAPPAITSIALTRSLTSSLRELDDATRRIAEDGDLRELARLIPQRRDELGALAANFNRMIDVLDQLAATAAAIADGDLRVELEGRGDLQDAFRSMLGQLHELASQIRATSLEVASAATEIQASTREQEHAVDQQSHRILAVSEAIASLAQSAEDISTSASAVLDYAEQSLVTNATMVQKITTLGGSAQSIGALLDTIREIADRSDLLALNGSLEATRAGEAGRGFALVATEMRRLAERVTGTLVDAHARIGEIQAAGASTVAATEDSRQIADRSAAAARQISSVTRQQSEETEDVSTKVYEVAESMSTTVSAVKQTHAAAEGLRELASQLEQLTGRFKLRERDEPPV